MSATCNRCQAPAVLAPDKHHHCPVCAPGHFDLATAAKALLSKAAKDRPPTAESVGLRACWVEPVTGGFRVRCPPAKGSHKPRVLTALGTWSEHLPARELFKDEDAAAFAIASAKRWW